MLCRITRRFPGRAMIASLMVMSCGLFLSALLLRASQRTWLAVKALLLTPA